MGTFYKNQHLHLIYTSDPARIHYVTVRVASNYLNTNVDGAQLLNLEYWNGDPAPVLIVKPSGESLVGNDFKVIDNDYRPFWSIDDIKRYDEKHEGYFFSENNLRFAASRVLPYVYNADDGSLINLFITSERDRYNSSPRVAAERRYTIRQLQEKGVRTVGVYMGYASARSARAAAQRMTTLTATPV